MGVETHIHPQQMPWNSGTACQVFPKFDFLTVQTPLYTYLEEQYTTTQFSSQIKMISSVQFSCSVVSDSLWSHGPQHARPPCLSPTPGVYSNSCPLSWWCHPTISSSVISFSSGLQTFLASGSFPMSQFFASCDQSIGASASASVLPVNIQDLFPLGLTGLILHFKGLSRVFSKTTVQKHQFFSPQLSL